MKRTFFKKGFTLLEVLVVVALIGILSAIIYANFSDARQDARNKALRTEIKAVQLALELYKAQNGNYPLATAINLLVPEFIVSLPTPSDSANPICTLVYNGFDGTRYKYTALNCFAGATVASEGIQPEDTMARCPSSCSSIGCGPGPGLYDPNDPNFYRSFAVFSAGGQCE